ncbi:hypothetical protein Rt10032_c14g5312 [Rhodotorula toruloides]|uniref:Uncharacterized protein n=1 Tax=Rhodotorula toruloides TaxID=5286 RepID=A0A511KN19_RHOTO|nr:hypothetical protein Rt10032_c14g5312 [Rhodotorula toruloides]
MLPSPAAASSPWAPSPHPTTLPITAPSPAGPAQPHRRATSVRTGLAPPGAGATTSTGGHGIVVEEPSVEATRNVGVLLGVGTEGEGLLDRVEKEVEAVLTAYERAFEVGNAAQAESDPSTALSTLSSLVALLSRSSVGGFVPSAASPPDTILSQTHLDQANERSRALYMQLKNVKEDAEVARAALAG